MQSLPIDARSVLLGAAMIMRSSGLARGTFHDTLGRVCVRGAIHVYLAKADLPFDEGSDVWDEKVEEIESLVRAVLPVMKIENTEPISTWNDLLCNSADEAADLLERAAGVVPQMIVLQKLGAIPSLQ